MAENERQGALQSIISYIFNHFFKHYKGMNQRLRKFKITVQNYNSESLVEPELFWIFQHKVEWALHFTHFSEIVQIQFYYLLSSIY